MFSPSQYRLIFAHAWLGACLLVSTASATDVVVTNAPDIRVFRGEIEITNNALVGADFGRVNVSNREAHSDFLITNVGASILTVEGWTVRGTHAAEFVVRTFQSTQLAAEGWALFGIDFDPAGAGKRSALVSIANNDPDENPFEFTVQGEGELAPLIKVMSGDFPAITNGSPASASLGTDFGQVDIRGGSERRTIIIANEGSALLEIAGWSVAGPWADDFTLPTLSPRQVNIGGATQLDIVFDPAEVGISWATLWITNNAGNPFRFDVRGEGIGFPKISVIGGGNVIPSGSSTASASNRTDFGEVLRDGSFAFHTFVITNDGDVNLRVFQVSISGTNAADFAVAQFPAASVPAGGSTSLGVLFSPKGTGLRTAELSIANGDQELNPYTFKISGKGLRVAIPQRLQIPRWLNDRIQLRFGDMDGRMMTTEDLLRMELQYSPSLRPGSWITLSNSASLEGGLILIEDAPDLSSRLRFYRVIER